MIDDEQLGGGFAEVRDGTPVETVVRPPREELDDDDE